MGSAFVLSPSPHFRVTDKGSCWACIQRFTPTQEGALWCKLRFCFLTMLQKFCQALNRHSWVHMKLGVLSLSETRPTPWPLDRAILSPLPRLLPPLPSVPSPRLISAVGPYPSDPTVSSVLVSQWPLSTGISGLGSQVV